MDQHDVALAVSLNMQQPLRAGSIIQGAITGCKSKEDAVGNTVR